MKYLAVVQARMGSTRLPGKVLMSVGDDLTAIEVLIRRMRLSQRLDDIVVATTNKKEDIEIIKTVSGLDCMVFVGNSDDVLDRYYQAARLYQPEYIVRLTADNPLLDWRVLDEGINQINPETEYLGMLTETFPEGEIIEVIRYDALEYCWNHAKLASEREHVTLYIKNHRDEFITQDYVCGIGNLNEERWTMDGEDDLRMIRMVYNHFLPRLDFSMEEIYSFLKENPEIRNINRKHRRNEGLYISLENDRMLCK